MRGDRLKELRESKGLSAQELATELEIGVAQVFRYEAGKTAPASTAIIKFAKFFEVTSDYLLGLSDYTQKPLVLKIAPLDVTEMLKELPPKTVSDFFQAMGISLDV